MKTLALAILMFGLFATVEAGVSGATAERPLGLALYDGSQPEVAERYGIEVITRSWPFDGATFECMIRISPKYAQRMEAPLLSVTDRADGGDYSLRATLAWESVGDGVQLHLYLSNHRSLRQTVIIPFSDGGFPDDPASGVKIDLGNILKNQK